jgi:transitional endoplasmic reticulum ATPase
VTTSKLVPKQQQNGETPEEQRQRMLETMAEFGNSVLTSDNSVAYHVEPKNKVSLPDGMPKEKGAAILIESARGDAEMQNISRTFRYRPWDGAYALHNVLLNTFGTTGRGRKTFSFMEGVKYPEAKTVEVGIDDKGHPITAQVPWGEIDFEFFEGHLALSAVEDEDYGQLFHLSVYAPKRLAASVYGFFAMIELYLEEHSIYKGKAITGTDNPRFLHVHRNPTIVYNEDVTGMMTDTVWGVMANKDLLKSDTRRVNTRVVLEGPYGTGKSEFGMITAEVAQEYGWTFIEYRIGDHENVADLQKTLMTAKLLQPAVVFIEDINIYAGRENVSDQSKLTNMIDGLGSKAGDIMIVMTSNHAEDFSEAMLRDGRIDALIHVGLHDRPTTEKMIKRVVGEHRLDPELDYDRVWESLDGFEPAFVRGTFEQACTSAIIRTSSLEYLLTTSDLVRSANLKRPQWEMLHRDRKPKEVTIDQKISQAALAPWQSGRVQLYDAAGRPMQVKVVDNT